MAEWYNECIVQSVSACYCIDSIADVLRDLFQNSVGFDGAVIVGWRLYSGR